MTKALTVNRCLKDKAMDHIDHALGRPLDPMAPTYREYFATDHDSDEAKEFRASPHWIEAKSAAPGGMRYFYVTDAGRAALRDHLKAIGDPHRAFTVRFDHHDAVVVATTRSKARYEYWARLSDALPDLTFREFCKTAKVIA